MRGKSRKQIMEENEVSELYEFNLGGVKQKVLVEGKHKKLPIVINLHGGPGSPIPFSVGCRGLFPEFTDKFLMVYWDQYGCGINNYKLNQKLSIELYVQMTVDLITNIKKLFPDNKCIIFAVSWGTVLAANILKLQKGLVDAILVWGQITKNLFFNDEVFEAFHNSNIPQKTLTQLEQINVNDITPNDMKLMAGCIRKYTNGYNNKNGESAPFGKTLFGVLTSPDYHMKDFIAIVKNESSGNIDLWKEIMKLDLSDVFSHVDIPYYVLQGDTDIVTSTSQIQRIVREANNPLLKIEIIKNSGHIPAKEGMEKAIQYLTRICDTNEI